MTRLGWTGSLFMVLGLSLGLAIGWGLGRQVAGLPGQLLRVGQVPTYEPVEIVPDSAGWPEDEPVRVATVKPPNRKEARKLEKDFGFRLDDTSLLGKFELPDLPDGGRAVVSVTKGQLGSTNNPEPVRLTVKANPPPLVRVRWEPGLEGWIEIPVVRSVDGEILSSWSSYVSLNRLVCVRDRVCLNARTGYEHRPWGDGVLAGVGVSVRF